jgi:hypothetical protein
MKIILLSLSLISSISIFGQADLEWAKSTGGTSFDILRDVATDNLGNTVSVGDFYETIDLDPGTGVQNVTSAGASDIVVRKLDPSGNLVWAHTFGNYDGDIGNGVACDNFGNIYVTGSFRAEVDFDPGTGSLILGTNGASASQAFILKLSATGDLIWAIEYGNTSGSDAGNEIDSDLSGNIVATGTFRGTVDFDPGAGVFNLDANPGNNYGTYIVKLNSLGGFEWAGTTGGESGNNRAHDIDFDNSGNVLITGSYGGTSDLDPTTGVQLVSTIGLDDIYVIKLDPSGNFLWGHSFGGAWGDYGNSIINDENGFIYVTGQFRQTVDFDPGAGSVNLVAGSYVNTFIQKLSPTGDLIWAKQFEGSGVEAYSMKHDANNNLYLTGYMNGTVDLDPGAGVESFTSFNGSSDIFVAKLDSDGNYLWASQFGGDGADFGRAIAVFDENNIYVSGDFESISDFNPSADIYNLTSNGSADQYTFKLGVCSNDLTVDLGTDGVTLSSNTMNAEYQWVDCNDNYSFINGATSQQYTATSNGNYAVIITSGACIDTSSCTLLSNVGVQLLNKSNVSIYPNPVKDVLFIKSDLKIQEILFTNMMGEIVLFSKSKEINTQSLKAGVYLVTINTDQGVIHDRIIKY